MNVVVWFVCWSVSIASLYPMEPLKGHGGDAKHLRENVKELTYNLSLQFHIVHFQGFKIYILDICPKYLIIEIAPVSQMH